jgi:hypothetical protein
VNGDGALTQQSVSFGTTHRISAYPDREYNAVPCAENWEKY